MRDQTLSAGSIGARDPVDTAADGGRPATTTTSIDRIPTLPREALLPLWRQLFGGPPPRRLSTAFLRRFIAFELQVRARGGLVRTLERRLQAAEMARRKGRTTAPAATPGTRLLRDWNGVTHSVEVTTDGYLWRGETWRSLSAIAREITGAHWSGPRFFGLTASRAGSGRGLGP